MISSKALTGKTIPKIKDTHGQNQGGGWTWGREVGSAEVGVERWGENADNCN